jgi:hypothetical protein
VERCATSLHPSVFLELDKFGVPQPEQGELKALVESTQEAIVVAPLQEELVAPLSPTLSRSLGQDQSSGLLLRAGCHNSLARRPATRKRQAAWSRDWTMKPWRS